MPDFHPSERVASPQRRRADSLLTAAIVIVLFVIAFSINNSRVESTELHPDETRWLNRSYYLEDFVDPFGYTWQDYYIARGQPPGGSYLMGLGLWLQGKDLHPNGVWDFHYGTDWNHMSGAVPSDDVLYAGRRTNAVVGALVVALVFLIGSQITNRIGGIAGALFLAYHPLHLTLTTQALSDQLLALSLATLFLACLKYVQRPRFGWALLMGIAIGVGSATKLAPMALAFVLAGYGVAMLAWQWYQNDRQRPSLAEARTGLYLLLQPVIAGFIFVAMYPFLWVDPIGRSLALLEFRRTEMQSQARIWPWAKVSNPKEAFGRYGEQLDALASTTRHLQELVTRKTPFSIDNPQSYDFILVGIGALLLSRIVIQRGVWHPVSALAMLMAAEVGAITLGLGVDFYRYYLPILLVNSVLVAVTIGEGLRWAVDSWPFRATASVPSRSTLERAATS